MKTHAAKKADAALCWALVILFIIALTAAPAIEAARNAVNLLTK